ncbi:MAG: TraR/DksA C4-type zinc finger protein [Bacteroidota bacterium]
MSKQPLKRYSTEDLKAFEQSIRAKLTKAHEELKNISSTLSRKYDNNSDPVSNISEDSAESAEKETLSQLAARQRKFISELEAALVRIKNRTYGICIITGELIDKERLQAVPHTRHSLAAKLSMS